MSVCNMICASCKQEKSFLVGDGTCLDCYDSPKRRSQRADQKERDQDLTGQDQEAYEMDSGKVFSGDQCLTPDTLFEDEY